ncbi:MULTISPECIES: aminotransferase class I/II-fold pyridoxal phosphate-dependent enzyme [Pantoea]|jgi:histidinol-phosphate/aromatic aminotransferase/cobyric acid decarboxylase-like protein|uniref:aminotransferase class I/II-fold pyridoxal phosphate-dependent enzyme n=1 Tax=Pantoea TaxID=53335 RepID=UPI001387180F|nr:MULTISPECIES: aminotransferase class I/II-fold pyridoxal phosphate-dependent enzyme [Pantoea]MDQ0435563.1 histidinol-phosphate/aromatic aminotransferase/cobyric acid decarboxylase-like protein [Pantoea agglomerans]NEG88341.1 aminotransferase class I/II-fold pyridoxal phosphate-dependent enzyme [Pantoea agglomerans]NEH10361.1 aminotransferase class I/II-fold pyridoxal phosphate-dependent enzyme [Pantoea agglomerans]WNK46913.1 aminotransferase class I/II-fold pyridoxal phosphate-dependent enzy
MLTRAIETYQNIAKLEDTSDHLNLAWTQDERDLIEPSIALLLSSCLTQELSNLRDIYHYPVNDPWGEQRLRSILRHYFSLPDTDFSLSCGAGVNSLLASLATLPEACNVAVYGDIYPDFIWWLTQAKSNICWLPDGQLDEMCHTASRQHASMVYLERPALLAGIFDDLASLRLFCGMLEQRGILLLIDESNANYHAPSFSSASLLNTFSNLIVLRGVSKAWGLGGLRVGFCMSSSNLEKNIRRVVPPMLNPPLTLSMVAALLGCGDTTRRLRSQIMLSKTHVLAMLSAKGVTPASAALPYFFIDEELRERFDKAGIRTKNHLFYRSLNERSTLIRMSVPLAEDRMVEFSRRLGVDFEN